ncbi:peroxisomal membrane protein PEX16 [Cephus cinctus]|uniref:Peroxisomal membrane protein PEX16 n=1 Tax=Cephus cinctus TaxID=211228 RepID=A0AAJ7C135_CEPCN|nr:peroxisomal membrane protein PEX16 [Cephus cinctus]
MVLNTLHYRILNIYQVYKKWIIANPQLAGDVESILRCLSYFTAGRFDNSAPSSELVYSIPNLIVLLNDRILLSNTFHSSQLPKLQSKIKVWLTVIEYTEALLEVSAQRIYGESGKWLTILLIQVFKAFLRLLLVYKFKERITQNPPISPLNREKLKDNQSAPIVAEGFALKRTGTIVRSVNNAPPVQMRNWAPLSPVESREVDIQPMTKKTLILAETLYILKPLLHLGCVSICGRKQWKPWFLSFLLDIASLRIYNQEGRFAAFTKEEKMEIYRRQLGLLLYLLRSPFYEHCSRVKIYSMLNVISSIVPFARILADPLTKYLPHWQNTYFYMWSC